MASKKKLFDILTSYNNNQIFLNFKNSFLLYLIYVEN
ncbi:hypothetical protein BB050_01590 [Flavobacterium anhuiense]|uniref:Uncharacterized protein n=1 Tax=Flavobacterium anhuiense TaxID=459526 RepID=A0AAC9CYV9_9FLAO|nr:hypothetical protein BB050_01590 [Flavobacterium anhuiense]